MAECLMDLVSDKDPDYVSIDGEHYTIAMIDHMPIIEQARTSNMSDRMAALTDRADQDDFTDDESDELMAVVERLTRVALPGCPEEKLNKLGYWKKQAVIGAFFRNQFASLREARTHLKESLPESEDGEKPSHDYSDSMEETQQTG